MNDFFSIIYECGGLFYLGGFSDSLFDNALYIPVGVVMLLSSLVMMLIYYYAIDHPKFARWYHWGIWVLITAVINFIAAYFITDNGLETLFTQQEQSLPYYGEFFSFSFINAGWTAIFSFIFSLLIKWRSVMCRRTPF